MRGSLNFGTARRLGAYGEFKCRDGHYYPEARGGSREIEVVCLDRFPEPGWYKVDGSPVLSCVRGAYA